MSLNGEQLGTLVNNKIAGVRLALKKWEHLCTNVPVKPKKDEEIKARVDGATKSALWQLALARNLDLSDLVREAVRDLIQKNQQLRLS